MLEVTLAVRVPDLHLGIAAEINAAVGARFGKHPLEVQLEVAVVTIGREEHAVTVADDLSPLHLPVLRHVSIPLRLLRSPLLGNQRRLGGRIEVGPAAPAREVAPVEQRREPGGDARLREPAGLPDEEPPLPPLLPPVGKVGDVNPLDAVRVADLEARKPRLNRQTRHWVTPRPRPLLVLQIVDHPGREIGKEGLLGINDATGMDVVEIVGEDRPEGGDIPRHEGRDAGFSSGLQSPFPIGGGRGRDRFLGQYLGR